MMQQYMICIKLIVKAGQLMLFDSKTEKNYFLLYFLKPCGCRIFNLEEPELPYNLWKVNSEITIHRTSGRHMVKVPKENL